MTYGSEPAALAFGQSIFANLVLWPAAFILEGPFHLPQLPITWLAILWLGIMATAIGTFFFYSLINAVGATRTTLTTYIFPLVGVILGAVFLEEELRWTVLGGGALVIAGVAIVNARFRAQPRSQEVEQN